MINWKNSLNKFVNFLFKINWNNRIFNKIISLSQMDLIELEIQKSGIILRKNSFLGESGSEVCKMFIPLPLFSFSNNNFLLIFYNETFSFSILNCHETRKPISLSCLKLYSLRFNYIELRIFFYGWEKEFLLNLNHYYSKNWNSFLLLLKTQ